ncbi:hypothetical protein D3C81_1749950 [compost metagenome]
MPDGVAVILRTLQNVRSPFHPPRHRAERNTVAAMKFIRPTVRLVVNNDIRAAIAPQRNIFGTVLSGMVETQRLQGFAQCHGIFIIGGEL